MPRKPASETENSEPVGVEEPIKPAVIDSRVIYSDQFAALLNSGIIHMSTEDMSITWRTGHLEHIANLYAGDPVTTERNYTDDLAVARAYSAETWAALLETSK